MYRAAPGEGRAALAATARPGAGSPPTANRPQATEQPQHRTRRPAAADPDRDPTSITVGVVDDEPLMRGGIRLVIDHAPGMSVVAEAAGAGAAVDLVREYRPRVLVVDIAALDGEGRSTLGRLSAAAPTTAVLVLAQQVNDQQIDRVLSAGASGFLLKAEDPNALVSAVRAVAAGGAVLSPTVTRRLLARLVTADPGRCERARWLVSGLTTRERAVLELVAVGMENSQIARRLHLSVGAVKAHISRTLTKLRCTNRVQAAIVARDAGLGGSQRVA
jgi:DNA-binding NarL/FixJ family response regulator